MTHPLAQFLAAVEAELQAAMAARQTAQNNAANIEAKLHQAEASIEALSRKRLAGQATEDDTAELAALTADRDTLVAMLYEARAEVEDLDTTEIQRRHDQAAHDWHQHTATEHLAALVAKAQEIDALLLRVIADIRAAGQPLGKAHLQEMWKPSRALRDCITREFAPY
jgi:chromosome segregation ATPase